MSYWDRHRTDDPPAAADREAAIREELGGADPDNRDADIFWLLAELAAAREREQTLRDALARAAHVARNLHGMIDRQAWRDTGGDDGQGHYDGDYRAEQIAGEIEEWAALAAAEEQA